MTVASGRATWQVQLKAKTLKALHGSSIAYFGDHVEMEHKGDDFASTLGVGGVVGSNFVWPGAPGKKDPKVLLTPEREKTWAFWVHLYQEKRLSEGEYLGELYDIGFDRPEAHAIRKGDALYYAFYADRFGGRVELRLEGGATESATTRPDATSARSRATRPLEVAFKKAPVAEARPE
jgi:alpha-galactosidase